MQLNPGRWPVRRKTIMRKTILAVILAIILVWLVLNTVDTFQSDQQAQVNYERQAADGL